MRWYSQWSGGVLVTAVLTYQNNPATFSMFQWVMIFTVAGMGFLVGVE